METLSSLSPIHTWRAGDVDWEREATCHMLLKSPISETGRLPAQQCLNLCITVHDSAEIHEKLRKTDLV